jgi:O-glycosyl hydrolase
MTGALMMANLIWQGLTVAGDAAFHWWVACSSEIGADPVKEPEAAYRANDQGWNDGLLYYDPNFAENGDQQIYATKRFYALGNFSRYVRPGDRRHEVTGAPRDLRVLAFSSATADRPPAPPAHPGPAPRPPVQLPPVEARPGRSWTLVVVNNARPGSNPTSLRLQLPPNSGARLFATSAVETSAVRDLEPIELPNISPDGLLSARVPPQSVTTYLLRSAAL